MNFGSREFILLNHNIAIYYSILYYIIYIIAISNNATHYKLF